jgi:phage terminase large subunit
MRSRGWSKAWVILPHDGAHGDKAGFDVLVIPN